MSTAIIVLVAIAVVEAIVIANRFAKVKALEARLSSEFVAKVKAEIKKL